MSRLSKESLRGESVLLPRPIPMGPTGDVPMGPREEDVPYPMPSPVAEVKLPPEKLEGAPL